MQLISNFISDFIIVTRPLLGSLNCCRFTVSCTYYAVIELRKSSNFIKAIKPICKRLISCWFS